MAIDGMSKFASIVGGMSQGQQSLEQNINPDDAPNVFFLFFEDRIQLRGDVTVKKLMYPNDSFIIDHPVYGEIDSPVLNIDGGYDEGHPDHEQVIFEQNF